MENQQLIRGFLRGIVLKLLDENGRMYGYEITQRVRELTAGQLTLTEGALYPTLHRLEADGVLTTETERVDGRLRKYYRIAPTGGTEAEATIDELRTFLENLQKVLTLKPALS